MRGEENARNYDTEADGDTHTDGIGGGAARFLLGVGVGLDWRCCLLRNREKRRGDGCWRRPTIAIGVCEGRAGGSSSKPRICSIAGNSV